MSTNSTDTEPDAEATRTIIEASDYRVPTGDELRRLRLLAQLSLREVADEIGVNKDSVWKWEHGERQPRIGDAAALLELYEREADGQTQLSGT